MKTSKFSIATSLAFLFMMSPVFAATVTLEVRNIEKKSEMHLAIYDDADVFENDNGEKGVPQKA